MFGRAPKKSDNMRYYEMLLKHDGFKAKPALLTLVGSVVASGGASGHMSLKSLVLCLVEALSNDDWATRKAAVETLVVIANVERDFLSELKAECVRVFENRRFDKVKLVRDLMNQMLEAWKQIPDVSDEVTPHTHTLPTFCVLEQPEARRLGRRVVGGITQRLAARFLQQILRVPSTVSQ